MLFYTRPPVAYYNANYSIHIGSGFASGFLGAELYDPGIWPRHAGFENLLLQIVHAGS